MSRIARSLVPALMGLGGALAVTAAAVADPAERVVIAGGDLTEIAYLLGAGDRLVGVDTTSTWPPEAAELPQIGYLRALSAEGVLSLAPELIIAAADAGPEVVFDQLRAAGVEIAVAPATEEVDDVSEKIRAVGNALGLGAKAEDLASKFTEDLAAIRNKTARIDDRPRVLFILTVQNGAPMVAGKDTAADRMIDLAAGRNAASGFEGYKPMSKEAIISAAPDVILMMRQHAEQLGGIFEVLSRPEIALTPAGREGHGVTMDGMKLLGFGPRTPEAIAELARLLHPHSAPEAGL